MGIAQYTSDPVFKELMRKTKLNKSKTSLTIRTIKNLITLFKSYPAPLLENLKTKNPIRAVQTFVDIFSKPDLSWEDISWLKSKTKLPVILKGILHPDDAKKAIEIGVDGIIISNHGGRQVDRVVSSLDSLKEIKDILPADYPVLLDSGIRTGLDVFIALAFGANAVCIGRPYAYALAVNGKEGVLEYIMNIASELKITMSLCGCKNIKDINREMLIV
jgi:lactate 2-monooxygenase